MKRLLLTREERQLRRREQDRAYRQRRRALDPEGWKEYRRRNNRLWVARYPEKHNERRRRYYAAHKERLRRMAREAYERKHGAPQHTILQDRRSLADRAVREKGFYRVEKKDKHGTAVLLVSRKDFHLLKEWDTFRRLDSNKHSHWRETNDPNWVVQLVRRNANRDIESAYLGRLIYGLTTADSEQWVVRTDSTTLDYRRRNLRVISRGEFRRKPRSA